mgnify:CR=1 FL=1
MSKKIDGKFLKNLIKEAMKEGRLDEFKVSLGKTAVTLPDFRHASKKKISYPTKTAAQIKSLANADGTPNVLDLDDIAQATGSDKADSTKVKDRLAGASPSGAAATAAELTAAGVSKSSNLTAWKNAVTSAFANDPALAKRLHVSFGELMYTARGEDLPTSAGYAYVKAGKILSGTTNPPGRTAKVVTQVGDLYDEISTVLNKSIGYKDISTPSLGDDMSAMDVTKKSDIDYSGTTIKDKLNAIKAQIGKVQMDQSIANSFATLDGNTIEKRFEDLANTMVTIKSGNFSSMSDTALLEFTVKVDLAVKLGNLAKIEHASAAGFAFEKFVINMFGGIGAGGVNGAIDATLRDPSGALIPSSQKLLAGNTPIEQSETGKYGLDNVLKHFDKVIYMAAFKTELKAPVSANTAAASSREYTNLDIYIIYVSKQLNNKYQAVVLNTDGTAKKTVFSNKANEFKFTRTALGNNPTVRLPLLSVTSVEIDAVAKYVSSNTTSSPLFQSVENAYRKLENMKRNTTSYRATADKGQSGVGANLNATDYISEIAKDYGTIKKDFNAIFKPVSGTATTIAENVRKITPNYLKKLFKESFKK